MNDHDKVLKDAYTKLYNSLGVKSELLAKTKIGSELNDTYKNNTSHNDNIDALVYSEKYLQHNLKNIDNNKDNEATTIVHPNPLFNLPTKKNELNEIYSFGECDNPYGVVWIENDIDITREKELWEIIREYQLQKGLTNEEIIKQISKYLTESIGITNILTRENVYEQIVQEIQLLMNKVLEVK